MPEDLKQITDFSRNLIQEKLSPRLIKDMTQGSFANKRFSMSST